MLGRGREGQGVRPSRSGVDCGTRSRPPSRTLDPVLTWPCWCATASDKSRKCPLTVLAPRPQVDIRKLSCLESVGDALHRFRRNTNDFDNYTVLLFVAVACVVTKPFSLMVIAALAMLWVWVFYVRASESTTTARRTRSGRRPSPW